MDREVFLKWWERQPKYNGPGQAAVNRLLYDYCEIAWEVATNNEINRAKAERAKLENRLRELDHQVITIKTKQGEVYTGFLWYVDTVRNEIMVDLFHFCIEDIISVKEAKSG